MRAVTGDHQSTMGKPWVRAALRCSAVLAMAALALPAAASAAFAAPAPTPPPLPPPRRAPTRWPPPRPALGPLLDQIHQLYQNAEAATEQYNATTQQLAAKQNDVNAVDAKLAQQQQLVDAGLDVAAELAADQYQNGNLSAYGQLLLTSDPYQAVHMGELLAAAGRSQAAFIAQLKSEQTNLQQLKTQAGAALADTQKLLGQQDQNKAQIARQLATVEQIVSSLTGVQQAQLQALEQQQEDQAQLAFLASGALGQGERAPSAAGRQAVAFALAQLNKPYLWGGIGPDAYDCSGLTSQAWLHAGVQIPRTSEDQWAGLQHVPLNQLRPGDLVVYYASAEHIAMYIGGGFVVQAPHTGAVVRISPIGMAPILGAVRPDPQSASDGGGWQVPDAVKNAGTVTPLAPGTTAPGLPTVAPLPSGPVVPVTPPAPSTAPSAPSGTPSGNGPSPHPSTVPTPGTSSTPGGFGSPSPSGSPRPSGSPSGSTSPSGSPAPSTSGSAPAPSVPGTSPTP